MNLCKVWVWAVAAVAAAAFSTVSPVAACSTDGLAVGKTTMTSARLTSTTLAATCGAVALLLQLRGGSSTTGAAAAAEAASSSTTRSSRLRMPSDLIQLSIEYSSSGNGATDNGALRATWMAQELLTAFSHEPALQAITLVPQTRTAADESHRQKFRILLYEGTMFGASSGDGVMSVDINPPPVVQDQEALPESAVVLWDQGDAQSGTFPELSAILQLVRDRVDQIETRLRQQELEKAAADAASQPKTTTTLTKVTGEGSVEDGSDYPDLADEYSDKASVENHVVISYTPTSYQCLWRAAYMALQLLDNADKKDSIDSYAGTLRIVTLMPSRHSFDENGFFRDDEDVNPTGEGWFQVHLQQSVSLPPRPPAVGKSLDTATNAHIITTTAAIWDRHNENKIMGQGLNVIMYPEVAVVQDRIARFRREQARLGMGEEL